MAITLIRKIDQLVIASHAEVADRFIPRLRGLIGKNRFESGEALLFPRCNSIHMWMMKIPIDVVFLKKRTDAWEVLSLHPHLKPWKLLPVGNLKADDVLELPVGLMVDEA